MKIEAKINNVDVRLSGSNEDVISIVSKINSKQIKQCKKTIKKKKTRKIIKKINPNTILVNGVKISLNDAVEKKKGTDYIVYNDGERYFISDCKVLNYEKVGGFHYGLIPEDFKAQNKINKKHAKKIRGINAFSIWTSQHRPVAEPYGMVFIKELNIWIDIYLCNSDYEKKGTSCSSGAILAGRTREGRRASKQLGELKYKDFEDIGNTFKKRMLTKDEFQAAMDGVKENVSARSQDDGKIKHIDFLTSKYGIEQATGTQWIWGAEDGEFNKTKFILGGNRDNGADAGSRAASSTYYLWAAGWRIGARFASDCLNPVYMSESE